MADSEKIKTYRDFWPVYLSEHSNPINRWLHFAGTTIALAFIVVAVVTFDGLFLLAALLSGYGFAWCGHFFVEKNRPTTFQYPVWSFISDWRMWILTLFRRPL
jgi:hypothetical protein